MKYLLLLLLLFFSIVYEKSLNIPNNTDEDFDDNINFYVLSLLLGGNGVHEILKIGSGERRRFINNIFQSSS